MKDSTVLALAGIASLTVIEVACLFQGINHVILTTVVAVIAGLSGYEIKARKTKIT